MTKDPFAPSTEGETVPGISDADLLALLKKCPHCGAVYGVEEPKRLQYIQTGRDRHRLICMGCHAIMERGSLHSLVVAYNTRGNRVPDDVPQLSSVTVGEQIEPSPMPEPVA